MVTQNHKNKTVRLTAPTPEGKILQKGVRGQILKKKKKNSQKKCKHIGAILRLKKGHVIKTATRDT